VPFVRCCSKNRWVGPTTPSGLKITVRITPMPATTPIPVVDAAIPDARRMRATSNATRREHAGQDAAADRRDPRHHDDGEADQTEIGVEVLERHVAELVSQQRPAETGNEGGRWRTPRASPAPR